MDCKFPATMQLIDLRIVVQMCKPRFNPRISCFVHIIAFVDVVKHISSDSLKMVIQSLALAT